MVQHFQKTIVFWSQQLARRQQAASLQLFRNSRLPVATCGSVTLQFGNKQHFGNSQQHLLPSVARLSIRATDAQICCSNMEMEVAIRELILGKSSTFVSNEWSFQIMDGQRFCGVEDEDRGKVIFSSFQILVTLMLACSLCRLCRSRFRSCRMRCTLKSR